MERQGGRQMIRYLNAHPRLCAVLMLLIAAAFALAEWRLEARF